MKLLELLRPKKKEKKSAPALEEIQPSAIEKMSEKIETKKFLDINPRDLTEINQKKTNTSKSYDTVWERPEYNYASSSGVSGSISGSTGISGAFQGDASPGTSWRRPTKKVNVSPIVFKINSQHVENDPDLILLGFSKQDGFPIYRFEGSDYNLQVLSRKYEIEELFDASQFLRK